MIVKNLTALILFLIFSSGTVKASGWDAPQMDVSDLTSILEQANSQQGQLLSNYACDDQAISDQFLLATDFCTDAYAALCGENSGETSTTLLVNRSNFVMPLMNQVALELRGQFPFKQNYDYPAYVNFLLDAKYDNSQVQRSRASESLLNKKLVEQLPGIKERLTFLRDELIRQVNAKAFLAPSVRQQLTSQLANFRALSFEELLQYPDGWSQYLKVCSTSGSTMNAFVWRERRAIFICPGFMVAEIIGRKEGHVPWSNMDFVMSHELGHLIDFSTNIYPYTNMYQCFQNELQIENAHQMMAETTADYWATELITASLLKNSQNPGFTREKALNYSRNNFAFLCMYRSEDIAPHSGGYLSRPNRVNLLAGRQPQIRRIMGCPEVSAEAPACRLLGLHKSPQPKK